MKDTILILFFAFLSMSLVILLWEFIDPVLMGDAKNVVSSN